MIGISNIVLSTVTIGIAFFFKRKLIARYKKLVADQDGLIDTQESLIAQQGKNLKQSEEIIVIQHEAIEDCNKFIFAFIDSMKKEMQEKDRTIALLKKRSK